MTWEEGILICIGTCLVTGLVVMTWALVIELQTLRSRRNLIMNPPILKIGTVITCPQCHAPIARMRVSLEKGLPILPKYLEELVPSFSVSRKLICPFCPPDVWFLQWGSIHTEKGWFPHPPKC